VKLVSLKVVGDANKVCRVINEHGVVSDVIAVMTDGEGQYDVILRMSDQRARYLASIGVIRVEEDDANSR
jgi:hypothetical protein